MPTDLAIGNEAFRDLRLSAAPTSYPFDFDPRFAGVLFILGCEPWQRCARTTRSSGWTSRICARTARGRSRSQCPRCRHEVIMKRSTKPCLAISPCRRSGRAWCARTAGPSARTRVRIGKSGPRRERHRPCNCCRYGHRLTRTCGPSWHRPAGTDGAGRFSTHLDKGGHRVSLVRREIGGTEVRVKRYHGRPNERQTITKPTPGAFSRLPSTTAD